MTGRMPSFTYRPPSRSPSTWRGCRGGKSLRPGTTPGQAMPRRPVDSQEKAARNSALPPRAPIGCWFSTMPRRTIPSPDRRDPPWTALGLSNVSCKPCGSTTRIWPITPARQECLSSSRSRSNSSRRTFPWKRRLEGFNHYHSCAGVRRRPTELPEGRMAPGNDRHTSVILPTKPSAGVATESERVQDGSNLS